jgi:hypothetical protein
LGIDPLAYEYDLTYRPGSQNSNADSLSRLPLPDVPSSTPIPGDIINLLEYINASPVAHPRSNYGQTATQSFPKLSSSY